MGSQVTIILDKLPPDPGPANSLFFGCDPDMHNCACAIVKADLSVVAVWSHTIPRKHTEHAAIVAMTGELSLTPFGEFTDIAAFCVEAQEIYPKGPHRTKNPRNILHLGHVAGAMVYKCRATWLHARVFFPVPAKWKGQIDKLPHHRRILEAAGVQADSIFETRTKDGGYCGIKNPLAGEICLEAYAEGHWKHLTDAIGLAQYAAKQWAYQKKKTELLTVARSKDT